MRDPEYEGCQISGMMALVCHQNEKYPGSIFESVFLVLIELYLRLQYWPKSHFGRGNNRSQRTL